MQFRKPLPVPHQRRRTGPALFAIAALALTCWALAAEPALDVTFGAQKTRYSRGELLAHPALRTIDVPFDVVYKRPARYQAVPFAALIPALAQVDSVQFTALDGFVANIPGVLLSSDAQPWLAVEPPDAPWPAMKPGGANPGPFYLVWLAPFKAGVSPEQWPYQIAAIARSAALDKRYPQLLPGAGADDAARRGMQVYMANCAACHKLGGAGDAAVGPDLNQPYNPTEYFQEPFLRKLIRDPASVRNWGGRAMPGFAPEALSEANLDDLIAYLRQMARQRGQKP